MKRIVLELGLRYRPAAVDQLEAHQAKLVALMSDVADLPAAMLEQAARHWVRQSAFMPKASDLVQLARNFAQAERGSALRRLDVAALRNARIAEESGARRELRWIDDGGGLRLVAAARGDGALADDARAVVESRRPPLAAAIPTPSPLPERGRGVPGGAGAVSDAEDRGHGA